MRVLFLTLYPIQAASPRYRVAQFLPYLREQGVQCTVASALDERQYSRLTGPGRQGRAFWYHLAETPRRLGQILTAGRYDVVFVQKCLMTAYLRGLPALLRNRARRVVYDFDDAVHLQPPHPLGRVWRWVEDRRQAYRLFAAADLVLAGNAWLAQAAAGAGANTELFPTVVDTNRFVPVAREPDCYRIGWVGNPSTAICLTPALAALRSLRDAEVRLIGAGPAVKPWPGARILPWSIEDEVAQLQSFSVGIMPLHDEEWTRGKCALKALLYMACGVPCVASPIGMGSELIVDGENGLLADSEEEWRDALERLRDPALRKRLGAAGRETVLKHYALADAAPRLHSLLEGAAW